MIRSHYKCCYFVLPCCTWDFTQKFSDRSTGSSHYRTYLDYIRNIGEICGFSVREDVLRIPSTKRVSMFHEFMSITQGHVQKMISGGEAKIFGPLDLWSVRG